MQYTLRVLVVSAKNVAALCDAPSKVTEDIQPFVYHRFLGVAWCLVLQDSGKSAASDRMQC